MSHLLKEGQKAPEFTLPGSDGKEHRLADYAGKSVILYFYPKDNTPGCTVEARGFTESHAAYQNVNAVVLGVSRDSLASHDKFTDKLDIPFVLLSDEEGQTAEAYGVLKEGSKSFQRSTFLIDETGHIRKIYDKVKPERHAEEILEELAARK